MCEYCGVYGLQSHVVAHITQYVCRLCTNYHCDARITARLHNTLKHNDVPFHTTFITVREWSRPRRLNGGAPLLPEWEAAKTTQAMTADPTTSPAMQPILRIRALQLEEESLDPVLSAVAKQNSDDGWMDLDDPPVSNEGMEITPSSEPDPLLPPSTGIEDEALYDIFEFPDGDIQPLELLNDELDDVFEPPALDLDIQPNGDVPVGQLIDELWELIDELTTDE